jgi:hypothetical protein
MPTYLNTISRGSQNPDFKERQINCRQVYEHVQDCPVCQQLFLGLGPIEKSNPMLMMTPRFATTTGNSLEISPTIAFLGIVLLIFFVAFAMKRSS